MSRVSNEYGFLEVMRPLPTIVFPAVRTRQVWRLAKFRSAWADR